MRTTLLVAVIALGASASSVAAQTAPVKPSPAEAVKILAAAPSAANWTGRAIYVPERPAAEVVTTAADTSSGPYGKFAPPIPDRRLDGSSWTDPQWEMRSYYGGHVYQGAPSRGRHGR